MNSGTIVTFYSFKGGVGRSFVLANIAVVLARWGYRVLCVDWDLEAPGLSQYLAAELAPTQGGLLDFLETFSRGGAADWRAFVTALKIAGTEDRLSLIRAGDESAEYVDRVQQLDWQRLYAENGLGTFLERVREEWKAAFDFVLLDSRTGVTDIGGICTVQLPDILVCALAPNQQNINGIFDIATRAIRARNRLAHDRAVLLVLPLVCRFDGRLEYALAETWLQRLTEKLEPLYLNWIHEKVTARAIIDRTTIPYFSVWSFGERLPVLVEDGPNPEHVSYRVETIAALLGSSLARTDLLVESRDGYTAAARRTAKHRGRFQYDVFIGAPGEAKDSVRALVKALNHRGISAHDEPAAGGVQLEALSRSRHFVGVFGPREGPRDALEQFLKQAIEDRSDRTPIPILLEGMKTDDLPALLRGYKTATLTATSIETVAAHIQGVVNPEGLHSPSGLGMSGPARAPRSRMSLWLDDIGPPVALTVGIAVLALIAWGLGSLAERFLPARGRASRHSTACSRRLAV